MVQRWSEIRATQHRRVKRGKRAVRDNNATVGTPTPETSSPTIHCVVCVNQGEYREDPRGVTVVNNYAACPDHLALVSDPDFSVFTLRRTRRSV